MFLWGRMLLSQTNTATAFLIDALWELSSMSRPLRTLRAAALRYACSTSTRMRRSLHYVYSALARLQRSRGIHAFGARTHTPDQFTNEGERSRLSG